MRIPEYMSRFMCIGGSCEDNCCIGWDVDIDKATYLKYQKVSHPQMKRELGRYIRRNPECYDETIDFAFAKLDAHKRCSFLNADHLCMIHKHLGESYLSNVCGTFPRIYNRIDGIWELSATLSCPEVARHVLKESTSMHMIEVADPLSIPIVTYDVKQSDVRFRGKLPSKLRFVRDKCLSFFDGECEDLREVNIRLAGMGCFLQEALKYEKENRVNLVESISIKPNQEKLYASASLERFVTLSEKLIRHLHEVGASDSPRYIALSQKASEGDYEKGRIRLDAFIKAHPHVLNRYFKNHIFKSLFPFSEGSNVEEATLLLLSRYLIVNRELSGLASEHEDFGMDMVVSYLGSFSKVIEHHKHYEEKTLKTLKADGYKLSHLIKLLSTQP